MVPPAPDMNAFVPKNVIARSDWVVPLSRGNQPSRSGLVLTRPRSPTCQTLSAWNPISMMLFPCGLGLEKRQGGSAPCELIRNNRQTKPELFIHRHHWRNIFSRKRQLRRFDQDSLWHP